jgi:hypothetical protein
MTKNELKKLLHLVGWFSLKIFWKTLPTLMALYLIRLEIQFSFLNSHIQKLKFQACLLASQHGPVAYKCHNKFWYSI